MRRRRGRSPAARALLRARQAHRGARDRARPQRRPRSTAPPFELRARTGAWARGRGGRPGRGSGSPRRPSCRGASAPPAASSSRARCRRSSPSPRRTRPANRARRRPQYPTAAPPESLPASPPVAGGAPRARSPRRRRSAGRRARARAQRTRSPRRLGRARRSVGSVGRSARSARVASVGAPVAAESISSVLASTSSPSLRAAGDRVVGVRSRGRRSAPGRCRRRPARRRTRSPSGSPCRGSRPRRRR